MSDQARGWADIVFKDVEVRLSWLDRLRVLFGRTLHVRVETFCEVAPGQVMGVSEVRVDRFFRHRRYQAEAETMGAES